MVNINLNQEDSYKETRFKEEDNFQETLNIESHDFADEHGDYRSDIPEFPKSSSNSRIYIVAAVLLIVVVVIVYFMFPSSSDKISDDEFAELTDPSLIENPVDDPSAANPEAGATDPMQQNPGMTETAPPASAAADLSMLSPTERSARISSYLGKLTIDGITNALGGGAAFTLVRFSNNSFLAELVCQSSADLNSIAAAIGANTGSGDLRIVSQESTNMRGRNVVKALLAGSMSIDSAPGFVSATPGTTNDLSSWARSTARSSQLSVKSLAESALNDANLVQVNLQGNLSNILGFLNAFEDVAANVLVEKISLINNDMSASSTNSVSLVMVLKQYRF